VSWEKNPSGMAVIILTVKERDARLALFLNKSEGREVRELPPRFKEIRFLRLAKVAPLSELK